MKIEEDEYLAHYGIIRRSGRYPWGSGGNVEDTPPRNMSFLDQIQWLETKGLSESMIAQGFGMTVKKLRAVRSTEIVAERQAKIGFAQALKDKGTSNTEIGKRLGVSEGTVRTYLAPGAKDKSNVLTNTVNSLREQVDKKGVIDVGRGVENHIGVSRTRLDTALSVLEEEGYNIHKLNAPQITSGKDTKLKVLTKSEITQKDVFLNQNLIQQYTDFSSDGGRHISSLQPPLELDPSRVSVVHKEQGGDKSDGMIYVRPGVSDVSIGGAKYAQVRVAVGSDNYLKGMAIYKEGLPKGVDVEFHTSKSNTGNKLDAMKKNSDEPGYSKNGPHPLLKSITRQIVDKPGTPEQQVTSVMNLVNEEGKWDTWSHDLSSQMLSKQSPILAKTQLNMTFEKRQTELNDINKLTNPTVKKKLLSDFADATDSASVHLKAAALPRTASRVILPVTTLSPNQVYAPGFKNGERVVLVRHPHGGTFEIPELTVNNKDRNSKALLGDVRDAIGIHPDVAKRLSGADFDGDTVLVIPNDKGRVRTSHALDELENFDPRASYPAYDGMKRMSNTQAEMGEISNLITDMSILGAPHADIARAVKHSMVVIDAEKHNLNHKKSYTDQGIKNLKDKYQGGGGASTIISRARSQEHIPDRKPRTFGLGGPINTKTGALEYEPTNRKNSKGETKLIKTKKLAETSDARSLMSTRTGTPMERLYADHSNQLKGLANKARLSMLKTPNQKYSPTANKTYHVEVKSLDIKLDRAQRNAPLERQAQLIATANVKARRQANPNLSNDKDTLKKIKYQSLVEARIRTGASKERVEISDEEWNAIQAGAISHSKLTKILNDANMDTVRAHATPKKQVLMTPTKTTRARTMLASGYTRAEVAQHLGVSLSTLDNATVG